MSEDISEKSVNNKEIVIYGGCFNPPLNSHFGLAEQLLNEYPNIKKVVFVPVGDDYRNSSFYEKDTIISAEDRFNMLKIVCDKNERLDVSRIELDEERQLTTYETLKKMEEVYPGYKIAFLMGSDNLKLIEKWMNADSLVEDYTMYILERDKDNVDEIIESSESLRNHRNRFIKAKENIISNISSTFVRKKLAENKSVRYLVPDEIYYYLENNKDRLKF